MANNREISQFAGLVTVNDTTNQVSIASTLTLSGGGELGIGTDNPGRLVHLVDTDAPPLLIDRNQSGERYAVEMRQSDTTDGNAFRLAYQSDTTGAGAASDVKFASIEFAADTHDQSTRAGSIRFRTSQGGVGSEIERLRITSAGDVGIGTTGALGYPLQIVQGSGDSITNFFVNVGGYLHMDRNHARKPEFNLAMSSGRPTLTLSHAEDYGTVTEKVKLAAQTDSFILNNLGIGTAFPDERLDVDGNAHVVGSISADAYRPLSGATSIGEPVGYYGNTADSGGATSSISFSIANTGASVSVFILHNYWYGGSTATSPYSTQFTFMIRNGGAGPNGHLITDYGSATATETYDSGNNEFDITISTPSGTRPYGNVTVYRIL